MNLLTRFFAVLAAALTLMTVAESASAAQRLSFDFRYAITDGQLTRLTVTELTPRADLRVSVKCPKGKACPSAFTLRNVHGTVELTRLVDAQPPTGSKITVRAIRGKLAASSTLTLR